MTKSQHTHMHTCLPSSSPPSVATHTPLRYTPQLDHCTLGYLPSSLACLPRLAELHAAHNALSALPKDIGSLRALRLLRLHHNHITALPLSIGTYVDVCTWPISNR